MDYLRIKDANRPKTSDGTYLKFWINRIARIVPLYLICMIVYFLLHFDYNPDIPLKWQIQSFYYSLGFMQAWAYNMALDVNYPAWTLSVEAFFYFTFPWLFWQFNRCTSKQLIYTATLVWIANSMMFRDFLSQDMPHHFIHYYPLFHIATFITGIIAGILLIRHYDFLASKSNVLWLLCSLSFMFLVYAAFTDLK